MTESLSNIKNIVLNSQDKNELYAAEIDLAEIVSDLYKKIAACYNYKAKVDIKGELSIANTLLDVCRERQKEIKDLSGRLNYNFRMAAKVMLCNDTYERILQQAAFPRPETKQQKDKLKQNRVDV